MNNKRLLDNIKERIALDNFNHEILKRKRNIKIALITASASAAVLASLLTVNIVKKRTRDKQPV